MSKQFDLNRYIMNIRSKPKEQRTKEEMMNLDTFMKAANTEGASAKIDICEKLTKKASPLMIEREKLKEELQMIERNDDVKQMFINSNKLSKLNKEFKDFKNESDACKSYLKTRKELTNVNSTLKNLQIQMKNVGGKLVIPRRLSTTKQHNKKRSKVSKRSRCDDDEHSVNNTINNSPSSEKKNRIDNNDVALRFNAQ